MHFSVWFLHWPRSSLGYNGQLHSIYAALFTINMTTHWNMESHKSLQRGERHQMFLFINCLLGNKVELRWTHCSLMVRPCTECRCSCNHVDTLYHLLSAWLGTTVPLSRVNWVLTVSVEEGNRSVKSDPSGCHYLKRFTGDKYNSREPSKARPTCWPHIQSEATQAIVEGD